jgi:hypothetical protein
MEPTKANRSEHRSWTVSGSRDRLVVRQLSKLSIRVEPHRRDSTFSTFKKHHVNASGSSKPAALPVLDLAFVVVQPESEPGCVSPRRTRAVVSQPAAIDAQPFISQGQNDHDPAVDDKVSSSVTGIKAAVEPHLSPISGGWITH